MAATTLDEVLANHTPEVRELAYRLQAHILKLPPNAVQGGDARNYSLGLSAKMADTVFVLAPQRDRVNLGFYNGVALPDPTRLLTGTGKRHRHVPVRSMAEADSPALAALMREAVAWKAPRA